MENNNQIRNAYVHQKDMNGIVMWRNRFGQSAESAELYVHEIGIHACPPNFDWGPDYKHYHVLHYITSGKGVFMCNDRYYTLGVGDIFYIGPNDMAYYRADEAEPWSYYWILYDGTKSNILLNATSLSKEPIIRGTESNHLEKHITNIVKSAKKKKTNSFELTGLLYLLWGTLIRLYPNNENFSNNIMYAYTDDMARYIEMNYYKSQLVSGLSSYFHLDRSYICKLFKKVYGCSPTEYINQYRIEKACEMLQHKKTAINEVASAIGFQSYPAFYRLFVKKMGMSPQKYLETL